jgi:hypothetical protein
VTVFACALQKAIGDIRKEHDDIVPEIASIAWLRPGEEPGAGLCYKELIKSAGPKLFY